MGNATTLVRPRTVTGDGAGLVSHAKDRPLNLTVADIHTYFVVNSAGEEALVHNCNQILEV